MKPALNRDLSGALVAPSSYFMKSPPVQYTDSQALERTEAFIKADENDTLPRIE